jgi:hypothetical protein
MSLRSVIHGLVDSSKVKNSTFSLLCGTVSAMMNQTCNTDTVYILVEMGSQVRDMTGSLQEGRDRRCVGQDVGTQLSPSSGDASALRRSWLRVVI